MQICPQAIADKPWAETRQYASRAIANATCAGSNSLSKYQRIVDNAASSDSKRPTLRILRAAIVTDVYWS